MQHVAPRHWYGFGLSLLTAMLWGILPIFLKLCLQAMDAITVTWYRFALAAVLVGLLLWRQGALPRLGAFSKNQFSLLLIASAALVANYVFYLMGLNYVNPETAQVVIQLAPFMLMLGGILFFGERFNRWESIGALVLISGLLLFFNDRLALLLSSLGNYTLGVLLVILGAVTWALYALLQKVLLRNVTAKQLTLLIYVFGVIVLIPFTDISALSGMNQLQLWALLFCCMNTVVGYGAFTEAMHVWQASKVSAVIALAPLFTFVSMELAVRWLPDYFSASDLDIWAYIGAAMVMGGSILTAVGKGKAQ